MENVVGGDDGLVVVSGPSAVTTTATVDRAMRTMLADHTLVVITRPHHADLVRVLERARRLAPVVVHVPDAPPSLLARITPAARALVDAQVRLVITTRPAFLDAVPDDEVAGILAPATLRLGEPDDESDDVGDRLERTSANARALARAVADVDRFGLLTRTRTAVALMPFHGSEGTLLTAHEMRRAWWTVLRAVVTPAQGSSRLRAVGNWLLFLLEQWVHSVVATWRHLRVRRATAVAIRAGLVQLTRRGLVPDRALVDHADGPHGWEPPADLAPALRTLVGDEEVVVAGLVALARNDTARATILLGKVELELLPSRAAMALGEAAERESQDYPAIRWYSVVGRRSDDPLARQARRAAALGELRTRGRPTTPSWLEEAGEDENDLEVQEALARLALSTGRTLEARRRFQLVARGEGVLARNAVYELAVQAADEGRDDDAEPLLRRTVDDLDRLRAVRARLLLIRMLRRRGRRLEATEAAEQAMEWLTDGDPEAWTAAVARELAALRDDGGDPDAAVAVLRRVAGRRSALALAAASDLAALEVRRGNWQAAAAAFPEEMPTWPVGSTPDPVLDVRDLAAVVAVGFEVLARVALRRRATGDAVRFANELISRGVSSPAQALLVGQIARAAGDVRAAHSYLTKAAEAGDATVAAEATRLLAHVGPALAQLQAEEAARQRQEEAARAAARAAMSHYA